MRLSFVLLLICFQTAVFAQEIIIEEDYDLLEEEERVVEQTFNFLMVEYAPRTDSCKDLDKDQQEEIKQCFQTSVLEGVRKNFSLPDGLEDYGPHERMFVEFVVNKKKEVVEVKIVKNLGVFSGENAEAKNKIARLLEGEAIRVTKLLKFELPAMKGGFPVRMSYVFPISIPLN